MSIASVSISMPMTDMSTVSMMSSFSLSLSLAIITSIAIAKTITSITIAKTITSIISGFGRSISLSYGNWLGISLAIVTMMSMASVPIGSVTMASVTMSMMTGVGQGHTHQEG